MHVIVATDGSRQSLAAARQLKSFADPAKITTVSVVAVIRPLAAVAFANDLAPKDKPRADLDSLSFRDAAESAVAVVAQEFDGWGPKVQTRIRSGSPASEIIKAAKLYDAGLVVVAAGGRGLSDTVLLGSTAQRVQHSAPCPVLVVRPAPRPPKAPRARRKS
ncbi:universal stress protein [Nocardioides psychrotolerans]|uniref:Nucleotide-binding universal stress protein, UspA family n=1 Tax=Nocardioides psychrotolerans TaxID=1005945 RepID=A0A1I3BFQ9_9ACTN|nr:universal stress protein [Nocardioides psychrotolerans]GEP36668.1 universal stress protein [Nocardioides psychrotolerans]SFH60990.1 Nucleotide-binding universal stress protein, UspA family [Nocardioides psychrotolerans]